MKDGRKKTIIEAINGDPLPALNARVVPALILDADGTLRRTKSGKPFIESLDDIELMPGIEPLLEKYQRRGYMLAVVSNQGGVAWGYKRPADCEAEVQATLKLLTIKNPFVEWFMCYFDPNGKIAPYNVRSLCRKPDIGMLVMLEARAAAANYIINWDASLFVGDRQEDGECARRAGMRFKHIDAFLLEDQEKEL